MKDHDMKLTPEEKRVQEAIRDLGVVDADEAFRERLKHDFMRGTIAGRQRPLGFRVALRPAWQIAFLIAVAVTAGFLLLWARGPSWKVHAVLGKGKIIVNDQAVDSHAFARLSELIRARARVQVSEGTELDLLGDDVLLLELASGSDVTIPDRPRRWFTKPLESVLYAGEIRLQTGPSFAGHRLRVQTAEGHIEVTGTAVSVYKGNDFTCVCVLEGTARIGKDEGRMEDVAAGLRKVMFSGDQPSVVTAIEPHHEEELLKFLNRNKGVFD